MLGIVLVPRLQGLTGLIVYSNKGHVSSEASLCSPSHLHYEGLSFVTLTWNADENQFLYLPVLLVQGHSASASSVLRAS